MRSKGSTFIDEISFVLDGGDLFSGSYLQFISSPVASVNTLLPGFIEAAGGQASLPGAADAQCQQEGGVGGGGAVALSAHGWLCI